MSLMKLTPSATTVAFSVLFAFLIFLSSCKKIVDSQPAATSTKVATIPSGYVMTPGGLRRESNVHLIEAGYHLWLNNGHAYKVHTASGSIREDFGEGHFEGRLFHSQFADSLLAQKSTTSAKAPSGGQDGDNWVAFAQWTNSPTANPITNFSVNWNVPAAPLNNNGTIAELIYIWDGIAVNASTGPLVQPVLQYGFNSVFGGQQWTISNWCVWPGGAAYTAPIPVAVNTPLQGVLTMTGQQPDGSYNYTSVFTNQNNPMNVVEGNLYSNLNTGGAQIALPKIPLLNSMFIVLEDPNEIGAANEYPNQTYVSMNNINMITGWLSNYPLVIPWSTTGLPNGATLGEHVQLLNSNSAGGMIALDFGAGNEFLNVDNSKSYQKNNCTSGVGTMVTYDVYAAKWNANSQAGADALAQTDQTNNGQAWANTNGTCNVGNDVQVYASGVNTHTGAFANVTFEVPATGQIVATGSITSSMGNIYVPSGTFTVIITQPDNKAFTAQIPGYGTQTAQTITFNNVVVSGGMSIYVTDK